MTAIVTALRCLPLYHQYGFSVPSIELHSDSVVQLWGIRPRSDILHPVYTPKPGFII